MTDNQQPAEGAHARLSPSASGTWMTCPGSVPLAEKHNLKSDSSIYAEIGTAIHDISEACLLTGKDPMSYVGQEINGHVMTEDHMEMAVVYVGYVRSLEGDKYYEQRVNVEVIPDCWGTADAIVYDHDQEMLHVVDLKTGSGVKVDARSNSQLKCYALGALKLFDEVYPVKTVRATIVQPPFLDPDFLEKGKLPPHEDLTIAEMNSFAEELKVSWENMNYVIEQDLYDEVDSYTPSEKACRFCRAKTICPGLHAQSQEIAKQDFADVAEMLEEDVDGGLKELAKWMEMVPTVSIFLNSVRDEVATRLKNGEKVPGHKLIAGRTTRIWEDEPTLLKDLKKAKVPKSVYTKPVETLSVAQMEKSLRRAEVDFDLESHIKSKPGSPVVARADNPKAEWQPEDGAAKDFSDLAD